MKFLKIALATAVMAGFASTVSAQDTGTYVNVGVKTYEFDTYNILGRIGYNFSENFGVEAEGSFGISGDSETVFGEEIDFDTNWDLGAYLVGRLPVTNNFDLFARVGYSTVEVELSDDNESVSEDLDGFAIGGGVQYNWDELNGVRLGYTYNEADGADADVIDLSYVRKF